ncbi:MAG TPA: hypothetical protein EYO58_13180, partial [Flavobacteriales bacterium]|nr:hypothetical protein [Flavobacteriales bacterium]
MPSSIDIASNALLLIGDNPISSFDDDGAGAKVAANLYPETKKRLLSEHPWSFALKQQRLNKLSQKPDVLTHFKNAFQLPTDLIRIWNIQSHSDYILIGNLLYSNENEVLATYVFDVDEVNLPPHFTKSLEYTLAADFAISVTESVSMSEKMESKAMTFTSKAMAIDSQGRPQTAIIDSPIINARFGGNRFLIMALWQFQSNMNRGELDPTLVGRIDIQAYYNGLRTATNVLTAPQGGAKRRPGQDFLGVSIDNGRLENFSFNVEQSYLLVFTDLKMQIYKDDVLQTNINGSGF